MESLTKEFENLPLLDTLLPIIEIDAEAKNLKVFIFKKDDLKEHFVVKFDELAVITISKDLDGAIWNLKNFRHSFLTKIK